MNGSVLLFRIGYRKKWIVFWRYHFLKFRMRKMRHSHNLYDTMPTFCVKKRKKKDVFFTRCKGTSLQSTQILELNRCLSIYRHLGIKLTHFKNPDYFKSVMLWRKQSMPFYCGDDYMDHSTLFKFWRTGFLKTWLEVLFS